MNYQDQLKALLEYSPETGIFTWKVGNGRRVKKGDVAGCLNEYGYIRIAVLGKQYPAQRLAYLYMMGDFPTLDVDHINLNKSDNRWCNLRLATRSQNKANTIRRADNKSGYKGVSKCGNKWKAQCKANGEYTYLGVFDTPELASLAYQSFASVAHGEFFRSN